MSLHLGLLLVVIGDLGRRLMKKEGSTKFGHPCDRCYDLGTVRAVGSACLGVSHHVRSYEKYFKQEHC